MALFSMNRYLGDDHEGGRDENNQQSLLNRINLQVSARKKKRKLKDAIKLQEKESNPGCVKKVKTSGRKLKLSKINEAKKKKKHKAGTEDLSTRDDGNVSATICKMDDSYGTKSDSIKMDPCDPSPNDGVDKSTVLNSDAGETPLEESTEISEDEDTSEEIKQQETAHNVVGGFTIIKGVKETEKKQVSRVLPDWLANPSVIYNDLRTAKVKLSDVPYLDKDIMAKLNEDGIENLFPVQAQLIPVLLNEARSGYLYGDTSYRPGDICCSAPTGSGKTLAFVLPLVQILKERVVPHIRVLVVLPVKDLAVQVYQVFSAFCNKTKLKVGLAAGQPSLLEEQEMLVKKGPRGYSSRIDILVATPGRLVDHIQQTKGLDFSQLRYLVIDEADRMMDETKQDWLRQLEKAVFTDKSTTEEGQDRTRPMPGSITVMSILKKEIPLQKLLFSATLSQNPEKLQEMHLFQPRLFTSVVNTVQNENSQKGDFVGKFTTPAGLKEYTVKCEVAEKPLVLLHMLCKLRLKNVLCFTNSVEATHRLSNLLRLFGDIKVDEFSSNLTSKKRNKMLQQFGAGKIDILICSDALARGIDFECVNYVVSYDMPSELKTYIHRIGRTARAGKVGTSFTLLTPKQIASFYSMVETSEKDSIEHMNINSEILEPLVDRYTKALEKLSDKLQIEKKRGWYK